MNKRNIKSVICLFPLWVFKAYILNNVLKVDIRNVRKCSLPDCANKADSLSDFYFVFLFYIYILCNIFFLYKESYLCDKVVNVLGFRIHYVQYTTQKTQSTHVRYFVCVAITVERLAKDIEGVWSLVETRNTVGPIHYHLHSFTCSYKQKLRFHRIMKACVLTKPENS